MPTFGDPATFTLKGSCGHEILVKVGRRSDVRAVEKARKSGDDAAMLTRFCPMCMEDREFGLLLEDLGDQPIETRPDPLDFLADLGFILPRLKEEPRLLKGTIGKSTYTEKVSTSRCSYPSFIVPLDLEAGDVERAYRIWDKARVEGVLDPEKREEELRKAAGLFDELGRFMERVGCWTDLANLMEKQGRYDEAQDLRKAIERELDPALG